MVRHMAVKPIRAKKESSGARVLQGTPGLLASPGALGTHGSRRKYLIGVDIGTQGTKACLFDLQMNMASESFEASRLITPAPGTVWQEADDILGSVLRTIRALIEGSGINPADVLAAGIDSQMAGIMGIDAQGDAVTYYDSWLDTRCEKYMKEMNLKAGDRITELTGGPVTYTHGPKILWWKYERPDVYARIAKFVLPHGYVVGKMAGLKSNQAYFDYTCIQYSGFGDNKNLKWSDELLSLFDVDPDKMARIVSPFDVVGTVTREIAALCGLKPGTPLVAGSGDTAASVFGSGMFEGGMVLDCAGTASVLCSIVDSYKPDTLYKTLTMMRSPLDGFWFPLAYINGGGLSMEWYRDTLTGDPPAGYAQLEDKAKQIPPGSEGILFIPHFAGRVLPNNPDIKGSFIGLDWKHTREHLFRATMEGIAYEYAYYLDVLKKLYPQYAFRQMSAVGGGARSKLFLQIKADVLDLNVTSFETGNTALIGSAVIAGCGIGVIDDYRSLIRKSMKKRMELQPVRERHEKYQPYAAAYLTAIEALEKVYRCGIYQH